VSRHHPTGPAGRLRQRDQRGAAMVEFALIVGIFVTVIYGLVYFGMAIATKQRVTNAAAEAARSAVGAADDTAAKSAAVSRVTSALGTANGRYTIGPDPAGPRIAACTASGSAKCITVTVTWDWKNHPVVPEAPGLGLVPINKFESTAIVQYSA
jgi:Flp pilus assembly protein TadG